MSDLNFLYLLRRHSTWIGNKIFDRMSALRIVLACFYDFSITFWNYITTGAISGAELLIFPQHPSSPPVFSGVRVTRSLCLCIVL